jgi:4-diphosphocytidyl-2-C-methyl-D-erythritol kinase
MVEAIKEGSLAGVVERLGNVLETVTVEAHPIIDVIKQKMLELGAEGSLMSGSGPTVFGIFTDKEKAEKACAQIAEAQLAKQVFVTNFV